MIVSSFESGLVGLHGLCGYVQVQHITRPSCVALGCVTDRQPAQSVMSLLSDTVIE